MITRSPKVIKICEQYRGAPKFCDHCPLKEPCDPQDNDSAETVALRVNMAADIIDAMQPEVKE